MYIFIEVNHGQFKIPPPPKFQARIKTLLEYLQYGLYEKEEAVRLSLLCAIAGESIFFLGPPGTAKSMIARRIKNAFKDETRYFEYLMNEFSTPDEIFGTVKLKGLDEGIYEKNTEGYLPQAHVAFLDEIWKSGPAILNTLLTIVNERKFHNGNKVEAVPLQTLLAASNELPKENSNLEALFDRFIIRTMVNPVENEDSFFELCEHGGDEPSLTKDVEEALISFDEIKEWRKEIENITLDEKIKDVIQEIRKELTRHNNEWENKKSKERFYVSDRRWKKIVHILKTSAFLNDRLAVDLMDCQLITYMIWNTEEQRKLAKKIVEEIVQEQGLEFSSTIEEICEDIDEFSDEIECTFYKIAPKRTHDEIVIVKAPDNSLYYKIQKNNHGIGYISQKPIFQNGGLKIPVLHHYYDENFSTQQYLERTEIDLNTKTISFGNYDRKTLHIETKTVVDEEGGLVKDNSLFNNSVAYKSTVNEFDKNFYQRIADTIEYQQLAVEDFQTESEKLFAKNLFAAPEFKEILLLKVRDEMKRLEDAEVELKKQRNRYAE